MVDDEGAAERGVSSYAPAPPPPRRRVSTPSPRSSRCPVRRSRSSSRLTERAQHSRLMSESAVPGTSRRPALHASAPEVIESVVWLRLSSQLLGSYGAVLGTRGAVLGDRVAGGAGAADAAARAGEVRGSITALIMAPSAVDETRVEGMRRSAARPTVRAVVLDRAPRSAWLGDGLGGGTVHALWYGMLTA